MSWLALSAGGWLLLGSAVYALAKALPWAEFGSATLAASRFRPFTCVAGRASIA